MRSNSKLSPLARRPASPDLAPLQARSRATRDRILGALARLLNEKPFDQISVDELTRSADCSTSSFYARFPTKAALLDAFLVRFFEVSSSEFETALARIESSGGSTPQRARALIEFMLGTYRQHRGLLRSLILQDRLHPGAAFKERSRLQKARATDAMLMVLVPAGTRQTDRARTSARFGLWLAMHAIEQIALFDDPNVTDEALTDRQLVDELTAVLVRATGDLPSRARREPAQ